MSSPNLEETIPFTYSFFHDEDAPSVVAPIPLTFHSLFPLFLLHDLPFFPPPLLLHLLRHLYPLVIIVLLFLPTRIRSARSLATHSLTHLHACMHARMHARARTYTPRTHTQRTHSRPIIKRTPSCMRIENRGTNYDLFLYPTNCLSTYRSSSGVNPPSAPTTAHYRTLRDLTRAKLQRTTHADQLLSRF